MAKIILRDAVITVDGTDLSTRANQVSIEDTADEVELTGFQSKYKEFDQGLKDATITVTFLQDFATGSVDAILQPLYANGGTFTVDVKAGTAATSATNPKYSLLSRLYSYGAIGGAIGDALTIQATFRNGGTVGVTRATA
jgi:hypothetical protein